MSRAQARISKVPGCRFTDRKARVYGYELIRIMEERTRELTPEILLEEAANPNSPLHDEIYDRDVEGAAREYYLGRARYILRSIRVTIVTPEAPRPVSTRMMVHVVTPEKESVYKNVIDVLSDDEYRSQMLRDAFRELKALRVKYGALQELNKIFQTVDRTRQELADKFRPNNDDEDPVENDED